MAKSLCDLAFELVSSKGKPCSFEEIWAYVCEVNGVDLNDYSRKATFYSNLSIDGRLFSTGNNWDLTSLQKINDIENKASTETAISDTDATHTNEDNDEEEVSQTSEEDSEGESDDNSESEE